MKANSAIDRKIITASSIFLFLCLLTILLPFNALINTFFTEKLGMSVLKFWKEGLFLISVALGVYIKGFRKWENKTWLWLGLAFCGLVFMYSISLGLNLNTLRILRLELLPIVGLVGMVGLTKLLNEKQRVFLLNFLIYGGLFGVIAGALFMALFGGEALVMFGYRMDWSTFYTGEALAFCQRIENSEICRLQGFLSGPNQMGVYLVLLSAVVLKKGFGDKVWLKAGLLGVIFSLIAYTFSRSSMLAFITMIVVYTGLKHKKYLVKNIKGLLAIAAIGMTSGIVLFWDQITMFFSRPESNSERLRLMSEGFEFWSNSFLFGNGSGSIGPASRFVSNNALIPENWFLQVGGQFGLIGLVLFLGWYLGLMWNLLQKKSYAGVALMTGLLIPLNLLHTFESAAFVYALSIFIGLELNKVEDRIL